MILLANSNLHDAVDAQHEATNTNTYTKFANVANGK